MRITARFIKTLVSVASLIGCLGIATPLVAATDAEIAEGKKLAFNKKLGNCLACHMIEGGKLAGNVGPPLVAMKARFPDFEKLKAQISDSTVMNPNTIMPPFGRHEILTADQLDKITKFIHTL